MPNYGSALSLSRYVGAKVLKRNFTQSFEFTHVTETNWGWRLGYHPKLIIQFLHVSVTAKATAIIGRRTE